MPPLVSQPALHTAVGYVRLATPEAEVSTPLPEDKASVMLAVGEDVSAVETQETTFNNKRHRVGYIVYRFSPHSIIQDEQPVDQGAEALQQGEALLVYPKEGLGGPRRAAEGDAGEKSSRIPQEEKAGPQKVTQTVVEETRHRSGAA